VAGRAEKRDQGCKGCIIKNGEENKETKDEGLFNFRRKKKFLLSGIKYLIMFFFFGINSAKKLYLSQFIKCSNCQNRFERQATTHEVE